MSEEAVRKVALEFFKDRFRSLYEKQKENSKKIEALEGIKETSKRERWENVKFNEIDDRLKALEASSASHTENEDGLRNHLTELEKKVEEIFKSIHGIEPEEFYEK